MKVLYLLLVSLDAVQLVNGLAFAGAEVTSPAKRDEVMLHGRSPKPTPAPPLRGMMRDNELFGRQEDINTLSTCAFIDGKADNAITCLNNYGCAFWTTTAGESTVNQFWDCCPMIGTSIDFSASDCYSATACFDYTTQTSAHASLFTSSYVIYCGSSQPYCAATLLTRSDYGQFTHFGCAADTRQRVYVAYQTPSGGATTVSFTDPTNTDTSTTTSVPSSSTSSTPPSPFAEESKGSSTAAIAGGAAGGVVGLLAICGVIGYLIYRKRKQHKEDVPEVSEYNVHTK